jgi:hypothetical protein
MKQHNIRSIKKMPQRNNKRSPRYPFTGTSNSKKLKAIASVMRDMMDGDDEAKINNVGLSLMSLPTPLRVSIFNYLGETQDELIDLILVSKDLHEDCKRPGIEWKIIPTIVVGAQKQQGFNSFRIQVLIQKYAHNLSDKETNQKFQRYSHMRVNDVHKFTSVLLREDVAQMTRNVRIEGIISVDLSSLPGIYASNYLPLALSNVLPNLRELDLSNTPFSWETTEEYSKKCRFLEKITCHNIEKDSYVTFDGDEMQSAKNLKEIYMDSSVFCYYDSGEKDMMIDLNTTTYNSYFIFYHCCKMLERVSIRNARFGASPSMPVPQNALVKFVRNAPPCLRWFRSDLTLEHMNMLRLERPDIELLN